MNRTPESKVKYLFNNMSLFTVATFIPKALMFIMLPLYTRYLGTEDYGIADLINTTVALLLPVLTLQVQDAVLRYSIKSKYCPQDIFTASIRIILCGGILLFASTILIKYFVGVNYILLAFVFINYVTGSLNNISSYFLRGINKVRIIAFGSIIDSLVTVSCNLCFLILFKWGLYGYLAANSIGAIVRVVYYFLKAKLYIYIKKNISDRYITIEMIKISVPMIFSALAWWVNNASDKYILRFFCGTSVVGVYSVASKIPSILSSFGDVISKAFSISAIKDFDYNDSDGFLGKSYEIINFCMILICSALIVLNVPLAKILFANDFYAAWIYVPPLLISIMINQFSESCTNVILAIGKTAIISYGAIAGAIINTICNFIIIPHWGAYGAAVATIVGFFVSWQIKYYGVTKYVNLKHNTKRENVAIAMVLLQMILAYFGNKYLIYELFILFGLILLYRKYIMGLIGKIARCVNKSN